MNSVFFNMDEWSGEAQNFQTKFCQETLGCLPLIQIIYPKFNAYLSIFSSIDLS